MTDTTPNELVAEYPQLTPWNPRDWWLILQWLFFAPKKWNEYEKYDKETLFDTARWLLHTMTWLPLILLLIGGVIGTVASTSFGGTVAALALSIAMWRSTIWLDQRQITNRIVLIIVAVLVGIVTIITSGQVVTLVSLSLFVILINGFVFGIAQLLDIQVASVVGRIMAIGMFYGVNRGALGFALGGLGIALVYAALMGIAALVLYSIKNQIRFPLLGFVVKALFLVLIGIYLVLVWYIFLGGYDTLP